MSDGFSITGTFELNEIAFELHKAPAKVVAKIAAATRKTAAEIEGTAKMLCPVDTGFLRSSIGSDVALSGLSAEIGPTASYGAFVELGTSRMAPEAFMGPAFDRHSGEYARAVDEATRDLL